MGKELQVFLYDRNLSDPTLDQTLTDRVEDLTFSTKLNGGFARASFNVKAILAEAWDWQVNKKFFRLVVQDVERVVFEGRIQDVLITSGGFSVVAFGYWSSMRDQVEATSYNSTADVIIKAALTAHSPQINSDQSNIDAPDITITSAADDSYLDITIQDLVKKLLDFGDSSDNTWYFAIWEDRIPFMFAKSVSTIDWTVRLSDLAQFKLKHTSSDLWNSVYALYLVAAVLTRTATADDTTSQEKYGDGTNDLVRLYAIPNLGTVAAAAANAARDVWLERHKEIFPTFETIILGDKVYDANGVAFPSSWVRAGDVIRVTDLVPASGELDAVTLDALRTFYILETKYDVGRRENAIVVDTEKKSIDALVAKGL